MPDSLAFLAQFRKQFPVQAARAGTATRLTATLGITTAAGTAKDAADGPTEDTEQALAFYGPRDIAGINPEAILRREPWPDTRDFEPNYFPFIEAPTDYLWRYTLDPGAAPRPWLALLAFNQAELEQLSQAEPAIRRDSQGRLTLKVTRGILPDSVPGFQGMTAHAQLTNYDVGHNPAAAAPGIDEFVRTQRGRHCSRLLCLRKLLPETKYHFFLVPYFRAGLGQADAGDADVFGGANNDFVTLPVFDYWSSFTSEAGDFEDLARRLKIRAAPPGTGSRAVDNGANVPSGSGAVRWFKREGALAAAGYEANLRVPFDEQLQLQGRTAELVEKINVGLAFPADSPVAASDASPSHLDDPVITLPCYGRHFTATTSVSLPDTTAPTIPFVTELNTDRRLRIAAWQGGRIATEFAAEWLKHAWFQVGDLRKANEKLRSAQAGVQISTRMHARYIQPLHGDRFILRTAPFHAGTAYRASGVSVSMRKRLADSGLPHGAVQVAFTKIVHQRIGLARLDLTAPWRKAREPGLCRWIDRWALHIIAKLEPRQHLPDVRRAMPALETVLPRADLPEPKPKSVWGHRALAILKWLRRWLACNRGRLRKPTCPFNLPQRAKAELQIAIPENVAGVLPPKPERIVVRPIDIEADFKPRFDVGTVIRHKTKSVITLNDPAKSVSEALDPLLASPVIDTPLYQKLAQISLDYVLPGLDLVENNSIVLCEENRRFIESCAVGANERLNSILSFNRFPVEHAGTVFTHFWDPASTEPGVQDAVGGPQALRDIRPIHEWDGPLGSHAPDAAADTVAGRVVLVIKGDLIRRYKDTVFFALRRDRRYSERTPQDVEVQYAPAFRAQLGADALAVGFPFTTADLQAPDTFWYFVLQEVQELPRFGLDKTDSGNGDPSWEGITAASLDRADYLKRPDDILLGANPATLARSLLQKPVQLVIHQSHLVEL